jgi:hypothetical protein
MPFTLVRYALNPARRRSMWLDKHIEPERAFGESENHSEVIRHASMCFVLANHRSHWDSTLMPSLSTSKTKTKPVQIKLKSLEAI